VGFIGGHLQLEMVYTTHFWQNWGWFMFRFTCSQILEVKSNQFALHQIKPPLPVYDLGHLVNLPHLIRLVISSLNKHIMGGFHKRGYPEMDGL
jgi:hypothetical protein